MSRPQDHPAPFTTTYSPIIEHDRGCFRRFCFGWDEGGYLLQESGGGAHGEAWPLPQLSKLKQLSELVAGPKWKNLIRKIGRLFHHKKQTPFQYSPESYALNFAGDHHHGNPSHSFSARFGPRVPINDAAL